jgi:predicted regulator of Ras-like GTPase activity (Roadblock/LC7/MglB family)
MRFRQHGHVPAGLTTERIRQFVRTATARNVKRTGRRRLVGVEQDVLAELGRLRLKLPQVHGALVASADGLLVAEDADGVVEAETMAAMSAAYLGLAQQIAMGAAYGEFQETVTRAAGGYVATFAAGTHALLTVLADAGINLGLLHHEARPVAARVGELVAASQA